MKIAFIGMTIVASAGALLLREALKAVPSAAWDGYLLGWTEASRGKPLTSEDFAERLAEIQKADRQAKEIHQKWHEANPGKSCAEMFKGGDV